LLAGESACPTGFIPDIGTVNPGFRFARADNGRVIMLRAASMLGLGGVFLMISPKLRMDVWGAMGAGVSAMDSYSPYSYVAGGILVFFTMVFAFNKGAQAR
jgi:hypothetical protein